ncbi:hypothetical protein BJ878DRAFT_321896 [Calycina marina]|uniref:Uncharacterized protein n=1 Tax=Calycina marina TaxID=1763456 RepID=A0A9P7Z5G4_9HELO|nr:hypothetical protein BJ878DRAFT_321896 [Calycina marina]
MPALIANLVSATEPVRSSYIKPEPGLDSVDDIFNSVQDYWFEVPIKREHSPVITRVPAAHENHPGRMAPMQADVPEEALDCYSMEQQVMCSVTTANTTPPAFNRLHSARSTQKSESLQIVLGTVPTIHTKVFSFDNMSLTHEEPEHLSASSRKVVTPENDSTGHVNSAPSRTMQICVCTCGRTFTSQMILLVSGSQPIYQFYSVKLTTLGSSEILWQTQERTRGCQLSCHRSFYLQLRSSFP